MATVTWKREIILHDSADPGLRNAVDVHFASKFGESLSQYCARDVHWIYELALKSPEKYFREALKEARFPVPDSRATFIPTTVVMFDWLREEDAASDEALSKYIEAESLRPDQPSQGQHDYEMHNLNDSWSGDEERNNGVVHFRGNARANPYLIRIS